MKDKIDKDLIFWFICDSEVEVLRLFLDLIPVKNYLKDKKTNLHKIVQLDPEILSEEKIDLFRSIGIIR